MCIAAAALVGVVTAPVSARAANCVINVATGLVDTVPSDGVVPLAVHCPEPSRCTLDELQPRIFVEQPGAVVVGSTARGATFEGVEVASSAELVSAGRRTRLLLLRPHLPLAPGTHGVGYNRAGPSLEVIVLEVAGTAPVPDASSISWALETPVRPAGEVACCPSSGEGDCDLQCLGGAGTQRVVSLVATVPAQPPGVIWRAKPAAPAQGRAGTWQGVGMFSSDLYWYPSADFHESATEYCAEVELWNLVTDTRTTVPGCLPPDGASVEPVVEEWEIPEWCLAPPVVGGWGVDVEGVPDPRSYLEPSEPMRLAWCGAYAHCADALDTYECEHFAHFCPELVVAVPDAGAPDASDSGADVDSAARGEDGGAAPDGGTGSSSDSSTTTASCACTVPGGSPGSGGLGALLGLAAVGLARGRRS